MANFRMEQINGEIQKTLSEIINNELRNPIIDNVVISVVSVKTSSDLSQAKVYLSILEEDSKQMVIFNELNRAKNFIRKELASRLNLRNTPALVFVYDESMEEGAKIISILDDMKKKGELWTNFKWL